MPNKLILQAIYGPFCQIGSTCLVEQTKKNSPNIVFVFETIPYVCKRRCLNSHDGVSDFFFCAQNVLLVCIQALVAVEAIAFFKATFYAIMCPG